MPMYESMVVLKYMYMYIYFCLTVGKISTGIVILAHMSRLYKYYDDTLFVACPSDIL